MISEPQARLLAEEFLALDRSDNQPELAILWDLARVEDGILIAPYNSVLFGQTGDYDDQLLGCLPILVDMSSGEVSFARLEDHEFWGIQPEGQ
ncbi:hypothetical protein ACIQZO_39620 [Streptomyces sp. NPDC097617]|uniref:hypothetical protein n=1 Tax=Streptomyces sp. NPDC097617 TaxID=3366091 RepID=UPI0037F1AAC0